jgi:hypothetical protein
MKRVPHWGTKILGPAVRNLFIRNYWLQRFVHPWRKANPGINLTNSVGRSPWQGWHEKWFRPYLIIVCSVSLYPFPFFLFSSSFSVILCPCGLVSMSVCYTVGVATPVGSPIWLLPSELYISTLFVHGTLHCYFAWLGLFQVIGFPLTWKELSNIVSKEIYLD